ncbi:MAG: hypothetical protein ACKVP7_21815 [Hyphomicrobiaceae bacterium]
MSIYDHRIIAFGTGQADAVTGHIVNAGAQAVAAEGGRLFAVFKPVIGLSSNQAIVLTEWASETAALQHGGDVLRGLAGVVLSEHDLWEGTVRPTPGVSPTETGGYYSHRAFDIQPADWPRFLELSETAWGNFEGAHASKVTGFWKARTPPVAGQLRVRLMAWYESLDAWERSRWWNPKARDGSDESFNRFRERSKLLLNTGVSILSRVPLPGEAGHAASATI